LRWSRRNCSRRKPMPYQVTGNRNGDETQYHFHGGGYSIEQIKMFKLKAKTSV